MSMFGPKAGTWWVTSKSDPRWNGYGRAELSFSSGMPDDARQHIAKCKRKYGEQPEDLEWGGMKD